jgi:DNA (cytosine-5)-methyltransferase 1
MGYSRAGFRVVGVDIRPQPNYPFEFHERDAIQVLEYLAGGAEPWPGAPFPAAVHVSPPCQDHIRGGLQNDHGTGWMLGASRELLKSGSVPWVIENVPGAPMRPDFMLCGSHFGLTVRRHRWFETSWNALALMPFRCDHSGPVVGVYGHPHGKRGAWPGMLPGTIANWQRGLGIDWTADPAELKEAVPPAYTEYVGGFLMGAVRERSAA